ncbi:MAG: class A beta-lactamase [Myxococcales bacterium]|nr:class A beta-lactamase [Myxococcales bacterium]
MPHRRAFLLRSAALVLSACGGSTAPASRAASSASGSQAEPDRSAALAAIEKAAGGRLGAYILNTATGQGFGWRHRERFGMCSTFKLSLAAFVLRESDAGRLSLDEVIPYTQADLLQVSPVTTANVDKGGMTIAALAEATQLTSDNAAANLLLRRIGGPEVVTGFWRELGDAASRLDRLEPEMNLVPPGEERDTVVPEGIARSVTKIVTGDVLKTETRAKLQHWMARTATGARRIRAALPPGWRGGDKTGTFIHQTVANKYNDIAVLYPPAERPPIVVAGFYEADGSYEDIRPEDEAVLARVGEVAVALAK